MDWVALNLVELVVVRKPAGTTLGVGESIPQGSAIKDKKVVTAVLEFRLKAGFERVIYYNLFCVKLSTSKSKYELRESVAEVNRAARQIKQLRFVLRD